MVKNWEQHCKCGSDLTQPSAVSRLYEGAFDSVYCDGHYSEVDGTFEPDGNPTGSVRGCDTYDGNDTCTRCGEVVG